MLTWLLLAFIALHAYLAIRADVVDHEQEMFFILCGGTWGMNLLPHIEDAGRLLLIDAINIGAAPGTPVVLEQAEIPRFVATKLSPHQIDLREVLALAELRGTLPDEMVAIGLQPERVEMSTELSPAVQDGVGSLIGHIIQRLDRWGHRAQPTSNR